MSISTSESLPIRRIIVPVDGSNYSHRAFNWLLKYIYRKNDFIIFAHVLQTRRKSSGMFVSPENPVNISFQDFSIESDDVDTVISKFRKLADQAEVKYSIEVLSDSSVPEAILRLAMESGANLIVIGSRGSNRSRLPLLGSVSRHLVTSSSVPVLVVPPSTKKQSTTIF